MFDYLKKATSRLRGKEQEQKPDDELPVRKPKKDRVFIIILIVFAAAVIFNIANGFNKAQGDETAQAQHTETEAKPEFRFCIFDGLILAGAAGGYLYFTIKKKGGR